MLGLDNVRNKELQSSNILKQPQSVMVVFNLAMLSFGTQKSAIEIWIIIIIIII